MFRYTITDTTTGAAVIEDAAPDEALEAVLDHFPDRHADDDLGAAVGAVACAIEEGQVPDEATCAGLGLRVHRYDDGTPEPVHPTKYTDAEPPF